MFWQHTIIPYGKSENENGFRVPVLKYRYDRVKRFFRGAIFFFFKYIFIFPLVTTLVFPPPRAKTPRFGYFERTNRPTLVIPKYYIWKTPTSPNVVYGSSTHLGCPNVNYFTFDIRLGRIAVPDGRVQETRSCWDILNARPLTGHSHRVRSKIGLIQTGWGCVACAGICWWI